MWLLSRNNLPYALGASFAENTKVESVNMLGKRKVLVASLIVAAVVVTLGLLWGWEWGAGVLIGLGASLGTWLGVKSGNKRAKETDEYRKQWLNKRAKRQILGRRNSK